MPALGGEIAQPTCSGQREDLSARCRCRQGIQVIGVRASGQKSQNPDDLTGWTYGVLWAKVALEFLYFESRSTASPGQTATLKRRASIKVPVRAGAPGTPVIYLRGNLISSKQAVSGCSVFMAGAYTDPIKIDDAGSFTLKGASSVAKGKSTQIFVVSLSCLPAKPGESESMVVVDALEIAQLEGLDAG